MNLLVRNWVQKQIKLAVWNCGTLTSDTHEAERRSVCEGCPHRVMGKIKKSLPEVEMCDDCGGCPLDTKAKMLDIYRIEGRENDSLTEAEVTTVNMYLKMGLSLPKKYKKIEITCPKWTDIDNKYKN